jgi:uncharacterized membrane protein (UPF0182 family)
LVPTLAVLVVLGYVLVLLSEVWTDNLWFRSLGFSQVFATQLWTSVGMFAVFGLLMAAIVMASMILAYRLAGQGTGVGSQVLARYRALLDQRGWLVALVPGAFFGLMSGITAVGKVPTFLAWRNSTAFGVADPHFGMDASFFVFDYPWYRYLTSYALSAFLISAGVAATVHFALGSISVARLAGSRTARGPQAQLSVLLGLALVAYGLDQLLNRYGLVLSSNGLLNGMTYTDDHARSSALIIGAVAAFITAALFFYNAWRPSWRLPIASGVLMVVTSLIVGLIYPAIVQSLTVVPNEPDKERGYIENHIAATRQAFGIDKVEIYDYSARTTAVPGQLRSDAAALPGIRLIDPAMVQQTYEQTQQIRGFYSFADVLDVARYTIDGQETDVVIAAREMDQNGLPNKEWNNIRTVYTHGYGLVAAYGNKRQASGEPEWLARDIPTVGRLTAEEPRIYFGELQNNWVIVGQPEGAAPIEFDTPGGSQAGGEQFNTYTGTGGVPIGSMVNRFLYSVRFGDVNLLLSNRVNDNSKILYDRTPAQRVRAVAPWLTPDQDIYPAIVKGRIVWIVDAYTTTDHYPNSHVVQLRTATADAMTTSSAFLVDQNVNYMRNSVKATVDAYDGSVTLYEWDEADPILKTWMKVFPGAVKPKASVSSELLNQFRYPEDFFKVQREVLARYHITEPKDWYSQSDMWIVPPDPFKKADERTRPKEPTYYLSIKWPEAQRDGKMIPGDSAPVFSQTTVYTPANRVNLASYMSVVADAASPDYGRLRVLRMSDTQQIEGPGQAFNSMTTDDRVQQTLLPFNQQNATAKALFGNLLTIPLGGGLLYVEPVYTQRQDTQTGAFPVLRFVIVRFGDRTGISETLQGALDQVFSGDSGAKTGEATPGGTQQPPTPPPTGTVDQAAVDKALGEAGVAFAAADAALKNGDLAGYQKAINDAKAAVERAVKATGR